MSTGSNQVFANNETPYVTPGGDEEEKLEFLTVFRSAANAGDVSPELTVIFRKNGNIITCELPQIEIATTTNTSSILSVSFIPDDFRMAGDSKIPVIMIRGFDNELGFVSINSGDGRMSITTTGIIVPTDTNIGMQTLDITYVAKNAV